ncbi:MAG: hypothetical protein FJ290_05360 [Planctomycetes bacterium]|nr:hypothetical protein [Planctomycetota bacterium]
MGERALVLLLLASGVALAASPPAEVIADWLAQDGVPTEQAIAKERVAALIKELGPAAADLAKQLDDAELAGRSPRDVYIAACERRREARLKPYLAQLARIVFTKHYDMGGSHYAYTEGQSDAQAERHFQPGSSLCLLELDGLYGKVTTLLDDPKGVIRDPDVSYDAARVLFAWKKNLTKDDYHLYEMNVSNREVRQLTDGLGFADYEGAYLPSGDIVFNSTRCVQIVDCWWTEVSNLYTCGPGGEHLRRVSFDQVHTNFPTVTHDGRVIYTRWDYNDRGQIYPQGLFHMNADGTGQTELYGNNSWFPTTILHARAIPGTSKYVAIFTGHHSRQKGWLGVVDPRMGRQENAGCQLIAPVRETKAVRVDAYGQSGDQWQYPYPLSETAFLVTFRTEKAPRFAIYWMDADGRRELLAADPNISCNQPIPLLPRPVPPVKASVVDYRKDTGWVYLQDIYEGPGLAGVERGTVKQLRAIALEFRAAGIGSNGNSGPAGGALISTPVSIQGTWDVKRVLGTTPVHPDGSACFTLPARTPVYFQALDAKGHAVQTMRSWMVVQPGESVGCVGCHENKNSAPPVSRTSQALFGGPQPLTPPEWGTEGFGFIRHIQPILDKHCVKCHHLDAPPRYGVAPMTRSGRDLRKPPAAFDPKTMRVLTPTDARWWHTFDRPPDAWTKPDFDHSRWRVGPGGFGDKAVPGAKARTPWNTPDLWLRLTFDLKEKPKSPALLWHHDDDAEVYLNGVPAAQSDGFTARYEVVPLAPKAAATLRAGTNTLAVHCKYAGGGRYIDAALIEAPETPSSPQPPTPDTQHPAGVTPAFSLRGIQTLDGASRRKWSDSYLALANRRVCDWINIQSEPSMLPPYKAGAAKSKLITMLAEGHNGVKLAPAELHRIATWIDLLVPYCSDYTEAMDEKGIPTYERYLAKRRAWEAQEARNISELLAQPRP